MTFGAGIPVASHVIVSVVTSEKPLYVSPSLGDVISGDTEMKMENNFAYHMCNVCLML